MNDTLEDTPHISEHEDTCVQTISFKGNYDLGDKLQVITIEVLLAKRRAEGT